MSILTNVKSKLKIAQLKKQLAQDPSSAAVEELARFYIQCGDENAAYNLVVRHENMIQDSEALERVWNYLLKRRVNSKVKDALQELESSPGPSAFRLVIETYGKHQDPGNAMEYCRRFLADYPECALAHRLMGELRFDRFSKDFAAKDGQAAEKSLLQALALDPEDLAARLALARLYYCCRLISRSHAQLEQLLEIQPDDTESQELMEMLGELPDEDEDSDIRFSEIEERNGFFLEWSHEDSGETAAFDEEGLTELREHLEDSLEIEGVTTAAFIDSKGEKIEAGSEDSSEEPGELFAAFVTQVEEAARKASLRMDLGAFEKGTVEGSKGGVILRELRGGTIAFRLEDRTQIPKIYPALSTRVDMIAQNCGKYHERVPDKTE